jgi:hypothetical protein
MDLITENRSTNLETLKTAATECSLALEPLGIPAQRIATEQVMMEGK